MKYLDFINEMIIELDGYKIKYSNKVAQKYGFKKDLEIISVFTFNEIDDFISHIINRKDYKIETTVFFFQGTSKYCSVLYLSEENMIIIDDKTDKELIKQIKADFITSLSHELRTPLSVAKGNAYLIEDLNNNDSLNEPIKKIKKSLNRIERILDQLTVIYMAEFGNYTLKIELIDINNIYNEVISDLENKIKDKNIEIIYKSDIEYLKGDSFVIYTLLRNLISNAVKYSNKNSKVYVTITKNEIIVEDNGIGIRENEKNRIFERFYRGIDSRKYAKGSGLGLAIVKHLCELSNYSLEFKSEWMVGSKFIIKIA
jgi:two-component system OmpR family sensor kinase